MNGGALDQDNKRYDEVFNSLVAEEQEIRQADFAKLNLPPEELLRTETSRETFPELNKPAENSIKIDTDAMTETMKTAGDGIVKGTKSLFTKISSFRKQQMERRNEREAAKQEEMAKEQKEETPSIVEEFVSEKTSLKEDLEREPQLKTIEELKKPELSAYPIVSLKTAESIQAVEEENVEKDMKEIQMIVEPTVGVQKELPQEEGDPFILPPTASSPTAPEEKKQSWFGKIMHSVGGSIGSVISSGWTKLKDSGFASQVIWLSVGSIGRNNIYSVLECSCGNINRKT